MTSHCPAKIIDIFFRDFAVLSFKPCCTFQWLLIQCNHQGQTFINHHIDSHYFSVTIKYSNLYWPLVLGCQWAHSPVWPLTPPWPLSRASVERWRSGGQDPQGRQLTYPHCKNKGENQMSCLSLLNYPPLITLLDQHNHFKP